MATVRRPRVLVVDDERAFVELLAGFFEDEGYVVQRAYDGEQALRLLECDDPPPIVLTDVMMPRLSGPELLAEARRLHGAERVAFVLLSAGPDPDVRAERVSFIPKPLDLLDLLTHVESLVPVLRAR